MKLPTPCNCVVQNVGADGKPIILDQGQSPNNSVVQSVNINTSRGKLTEWFLIILMTTILFLGFFMLAKPPNKIYLSFVNGTVQTMDTAPTIKTITVTNVMTNTITVSVTNIVELVDVSPSVIEISFFEWRVIDDAIHLKYVLENISSNELTNIKLDLKALPISKIIKDVEDGEPTILAPFKMKVTEIIVPVSTNQITNVSMRVVGVQRKP